MNLGNFVNDHDSILGVCEYLGRDDADSWGSMIVRFDERGDVEWVGAWPERVPFGDAIELTGAGKAVA